MSLLLADFPLSRRHGMLVGLTSNDTEGAGLCRHGSGVYPPRAECGNVPASWRSRVFDGENVATWHVIAIAGRSCGNWFVARGEVHTVVFVHLGDKVACNFVLKMSRKARLGKSKLCEANCARCDAYSDLVTAELVTGDDNGRDDIENIGNVDVEIEVETVVQRATGDVQVALLVMISRGPRTHSASRYADHSCRRAPICEDRWLTTGPVRADDLPLIVHSQDEDVFGDTNQEDGNDARANRCSGPEPGWYRPHGAIA
ncbi:hypothetical protein BU25DRAFT_422267 [Macroventuria anomochaeta]|uniref:Uncharacterized protein n=1 Tax=Macroventuria anomochaeta TaxID=301207 RepID=A0ACB6RYT9_9PLEO|nr:uncharacterized protein BU25DRAFT_422267 [Macroventuria anomochaeta]KAF2626944.1 hypothetical protein BU25DRAFT_422267 [Macroventuria anomochaeta]